MDINGRDTYAHLDALGDRSVVMQYLNDRAHQRGHDPLNFGLLDPAAIGQQRAIDAVNAMGYMQSNWEAVEALVDEILYNNYMLRDFVPVNDTYPEGTVQIPVTVTDYAGEPQPITYAGQDVPSVELNQWKQTIDSTYFGIKASILRKDVMTAMLTGVPLQQRSVRAATSVSMKKIQEIAMTGAGIAGETGLVNQKTGAGAGLARTTNSTAAFATASAEQMEQDISAAIERVIADTNGIAGETIGGELVVLAPPALAGRIGGSLRIADTATSVWAYLRENNAWRALDEGRNTIRLRSSVFCLAANNPGASKDRIVVYPKSDLVMEMFEVITPRIANMIQTDYGVSLPFEFDVTGLHVARPDCIQYITSA